MQTAFVLLWDACKRVISQVEDNRHYSWRRWALPGRVRQASARSSPPSTVQEPPPGSAPIRRTLGAGDLLLGHTASEAQSFALRCQRRFAHTHGHRTSHDCHDCHQA
jgi:hypothetical protein